MAMVFTATLTQHSISTSSLSPFLSTLNRRKHIYIVRAATVAADEPSKDAGATQEKITPKLRPKKIVYSMKKGQIVRVDKAKYLNSINYLSVDHPTYFKGLDYIYENRGEVLDLRNFDEEYALIAWVGVPTAPAWLPTDMLIKSDKLDYERM